MITRTLHRIRLSLFTAALLGAVGASSASAQYEMSGSTQNRLFQADTIADLAVTNGGSGYTSAPTVALSGGSGSGAIIVATVSGGQVTGFTINAAGSGYSFTNPPTVTLSGGGGTGATARVIFRAVPDGLNPPVTTSQFASIASNSGGSAAVAANEVVSVRYPSSDGGLVLQRSAIGSTFAAGVPRFLLGDVIPVPATQLDGITPAGPNYWRAQPVEVGETFSQTATSTTDTPLPLELASIQVTSGGSGYSSVPAVSITGGGGSGATATAVISQGVVTNILLNNTGSGYTSLPAVTLSGGGGTGAVAEMLGKQSSFYFSPHAERVFATQAGRVSVTWVTRLPITTADEPETAKYRFRQESFTVSSTTAKPTRRIYWTERSFDGPLINIPLGKIETINPVFSSFFPALVAKEYTRVGASESPDVSLPPERRTLWFDKSSGIGQLHAYNREGRIFVEYLGPIKEGSGGEVHEFLGADILEVVRVASPTATDVYLGDQLTPRTAGGRLLPLEQDAEWLAYPVNSVSTNNETFYGSITRRDGVIEYFAERENLSPDRVAFYWLEESDAAIHFQSAANAPDLGIYWPRIRSHYRQIWPDDVTEYAHYTVGTLGSTPATGLAFTGGQQPQIIFQDDPAQSEARIDSSSQRLFVQFTGADGLNRSLLKFSGTNELWYVRLFTQLEDRVRRISVTDGGSGYTEAPTVTFTNGGDGATAVATVVDGVVVSITVTDPGRNFTADTQVVISGGGGSGATAEVTILGFLEGDAENAIYADAVVGERIDAPEGHEIAGYIAAGTGYNVGAYVDPFDVGVEEAATGAIIPINAMPADDVLKVWWFKEVVPANPAFQPFYVPAKIGTYNLAYPEDPALIVLASNEGSGSLASAEIAGSLYVQNDRTKVGFNPNEEHAVALGGRLYALRDDLNNTSSNASVYTSEPYVLLDYTDLEDGRPAMRAFRVERELDRAGTENDWKFNYPVTAGTILQPPMPLPILPLPVNANGDVVNEEVPAITDLAAAENAPPAYDSFTFKDRKGYDWVYRGPHGAGPVNSIAISSGGAGYTSAPTVSFVGGGGSGAAATATVTDGEVTAIEVTALGSGYTSAPTIEISGGEGTGATAQAIVGPTLGMQFYYLMQENFYVPGIATQPAVGTVLPYLRPLAEGVPQGDAVTGTPLTITYRPAWPELAPELRIAETLTLPKFGLPAVLTQTSVELLYQQSIAHAGNAQPSVTLHDPIREKSYALGELNELDRIPDSVLTSDYQGRLYFQGLPPHLQNRVFFDGNRGTDGALVFLGEFVDEIAGEDYVSLNVLGIDDVAALKALCQTTDTNKSKWDSAIDELNTVVETFVEDVLLPGTYVSDGSPVTVGPTVLAQPSDSDTAVVNYALTATGKGSGWVSLIFGDGEAFTPAGEPVSAAVFKVAPRLYTGELKVEPSSNPLDEMVSLRHSGDFAAEPGNYEFEWRYAPPVDGVAPAVYTYALTALASDTWLIVPNPENNLPNAAEYAAAGDVYSLPHNRAINTDDSRVATQPDLVARKSNALDFSGGVPGRIIFSADLSDTNAGLVLYVNGAAAIAYNAPDSFANLSSSTGLVGSGLTHQFEVDPNAFQAGTNRIEVALFSGSAEDAVSTFDFRLHASTETDEVAGSTTWQTPSGVLSSQVIVGGSPTAPLGSPLLVLTDNYFTLRYRPKINTGNILAEGSNQSEVGWSRWTQPKLVEGWIKRVLAGINPFNQRVTDLYNNAINTDVSLLTQAGTRWEGDISLNLANIQDFGLIEIYETVLNRGKMLSIESGFDYAPANDALLLAAGYLNDLYTLLGNEAFADAANPTISIDDSSTVTEVNTSRFSFEGQVTSVLEEELALLRGRDDFLSPGVTVSPAYNRLYWNYTRGINSGEALYAANYNIAEKSGSSTADGVVDAADAYRMFPQAHGDAYGHYLTALSVYLGLLQNPNLTWEPRSEAVSVLGQSIQIDYQDERKFAQAALNLARTAEQVVGLTHRQSYRDDPSAGWSHFRDGATNTRTGITRHWGLDEWTSRATQGAYYNWVIGNSILPEQDDNPDHTGIQVIDRSTVLELSQLPTMADSFQTKLDNANAHLNPLGLSPHAIAFDISPSELKAGNSHFDQIYERALRSVVNAKGAFDQAARMTRLLRNQENQIQSLNDAIVDEEFAFEVALIDIFGQAYPSEIGAGRTYAQGYAGPDLYLWYVVDRPTDLVDTGSTYDISITLPKDVPQLSTDFLNLLDPAVQSISLNLTPQTVSIQPDRTVQFSDEFRRGQSMGLRPTIGSVQIALVEAYQARVEFMAAGDALRLKRLQVAKQLDLLLELAHLHAEIVAKQANATTEILRLRRVQADLESTSELLATTGDIVYNSFEAASIAPPESAGLSSDFTSTLRSALKGWGTGIDGGLKLASVGLQGGARLAGIDSERIAAITETEILGLGFDYEERQAFYEFQLSLNELSSSLFEAAQLATALQQANERVRNEIATGNTLLAQRETFRKRAAANIQGYRTKDLTFRTFRNEALEQYRSLYDLAARYTYLAAKAYDYETGLLGTTTGQTAINNIVSSRALGDLTGGTPQATVSEFGDAGLAGTMARLQADWAVAKPRLGINNPDTNGTVFSLRRELFRLSSEVDGDTAWRQTLEQHIVSDIMADPDVAAYARNVGKGDGSAVPGIIIPFSSLIQKGYNFFGHPLAGGDHVFTDSNYATKIFSVGVVLRDYVGMDAYAQRDPGQPGPDATDPNALAATPYLYLLPTGTDYMLAPPLGDTGEVRAFTVHDQALPLPFNLGGSDFSDSQFFSATDTLSEKPWILRKHQAFRAVDDPAFFYSTVPAEFTSSRLVGRSVWNGGWKLVIPAYTLLSDEHEGLNRFAASVKDIELFLRTYSNSGN
ncbi:hypothetical protein [Actomonas aquatica]|uniref:Uncharacterized protein n=1 Tax=Actomonas aquatica TaxID=2866162 RepID=A0ABZ1C8R5_9BACT|nr:hypothetical protein [Opitutus sp. WL0086]WRQ86715.1 hypothetical protein K1X11_018030 [Opitutus sp. WL0086]